MGLNQIPPRLIQYLFERAEGRCECRGKEDGCLDHPEGQCCQVVLQNEKANENSNWIVHRIEREKGYSPENCKAYCASCYYNIRKW